MPGLQSFEQGLVDLARLCQLRREHRRVSSTVEGFDRQHTRSLVIPVILADENARKPTEDHVRTREAQDPDYLFQIGAVPPIRERLQHILARRVFSFQEPDVLNAQLSHGMAEFHFAHRAEGNRALPSHVVVAGFAMGQIDGGHSLALVQQLR